MLVLERIKDEVFFEKKKLTIVKQETKGPGKEVVKVDGLPGSNGQKWISLSKINPGMNEISCQGREVIITSKYSLTTEESNEVKKLQTRIDEIINNAKSRYVQKPVLVKHEEIDNMTQEEKLRKIEEVKKYYGL